MHVDIHTLTDMQFKFASIVRVNFILVIVVRQGRH